MRVCAKSREALDTPVAHLALHNQVCYYPIIKSVKSRKLLNRPFNNYQESIGSIVMKVQDKLIILISI